MKKFRLPVIWPLFGLALISLFAPQSALMAQTPTAARPSTPAAVKAPFPYVHGEAFHILPETHTDESGYFSIVEGHNGRVYVGTAKYDYNAFLVEFDPKTKQQKIVIDTNKLNGLTATGYASQSKIHTRNYVGQSGKIYCGSQEGYRRIPGDVSVYPGGYVMTYDPKTEKAESLGMPSVGEGVIDVVADEARGNLYVVTSSGDDGKSHWLIGDLKTKTYRDLGILTTAYASTLMDKDGRAHVITADFQIATYNPNTQKVTTREVWLNNKKWAFPKGASVPTWQLSPDGRSAYLIMMSDPTLWKIGLTQDDGYQTEVLGRMIEGEDYDSRSSLTIAPDGRVYILEKVDNETKFGGGYLHHVTRYDPKKKKIEDLGVLAVDNPDFFDFGPRKDGTNPPWSHGYHTLPDGVLTPLHGHQGLIATRNGDLYALILYPFTLLHIPSKSIGVKPIKVNDNGSRSTPAKSNAAQPLTATFVLKKQVAFAAPNKIAPVANKTSTNAAAPYAHQYNQFALRAIDGVEKNLPEMTRVAEVVAERNIKGGMLGFAWNSQSLQQDLAGRAGGLMHIDFGRSWKDRDPAGDKFNVVIVGWDRAPREGELANLQQLKAAGNYIIGFGPRGLPELAEFVNLSDAFFDSGLGADDRVVNLPNGAVAGRGNAFVNMLNGWAFTGEFVGALTRKGKMPPLWKAWMYVDGKDWSNKYFQQKQFHDDFTIAPLAPGFITRAFLHEIRANIGRFETGQSEKVVQAAKLISDENNAGRKTIISAMGHAPWTYVGYYEDKKWGLPFELESSVPNHVESYKSTPEGALVLRLGYGGLDNDAAAIYKGKKQRVILISVPDERPDFQATQDVLMNINMGWQYGDAMITIPGYPVKMIPPSGMMQVVAYENINVETLARLKP